MNSGFSKVHPSIGAMYYIALFIFAFLIENPLYLILLLLSCLTFLWVQKDKQESRKLWGMYLCMAALIIIINPLINHRGATILFWVMDKPVTAQAIVYGCKMAVSFLAMMGCVSCFHIVVSPHKLMFLISHTLPKLSFLLMMISRFVPLLIQRIRQLSTVQTFMGRGMDIGTFKTKINNGMQILKILMTWSLEESIKTSQSMKARGFGLGKRSSYFEYTLHRKDYLQAWTFVFLILAIFIGIFAGYGTMTIDTTPHFFSMDMFEYVFLALFCFFLFLPLWSERKRWIR